MQANPVLERNLLALSSCHPVLSAIIGGLEPSPFISFLQSRTGHLVPVQSVNNNRIPLHSKFDPIREGERFLEMYSDSGCLVFFGFGAGYHILPFLKSTGVSNIIIIDRDYRMFRSVIETIDICPIIVDPRVTFLIDRNIDEICDFILHHYFPVIAGNLKTIALGSRVNLEKDYFQGIVTGIRTTINSIADDYTVQARFGEKWFKNTIFNLKKAEASTVTLKSRPRVLVTGAGPSLEDQIGKIKKMRTGSTLIATDTSLPVLLHWKIMPDMVISIDCQHVSYHHFLKGIPGNIPLILDLASPVLLSRLSNNVLFFSSGHPFSQYISHNFRKFPYVDTSGGNVSHAAVSLAEALGAAEIHLFGIDFSYPGGKTYARGSYLYPYFESMENRLEPVEKFFFSFIFRGKNVIKEKQGDVFRYTTSQLVSYKERMESAINMCRARIVQEQGRGLPLVFRQDTDDEADRDTVIFAQGPAITDWKSFLKEYIAQLDLLPRPYYPVAKYLFGLSAQEKELMYTLFPAATFLREFANFRNLGPPELLEKTIEWTKEKIIKLAEGD